MPRYYSLSFNYQGHHVNNPDCDATANTDLTKAEIAADALLDGLSVKHKHQYAWPDGSLLKYAASDLDENSLAALIQSGIPSESIISACDVHEVDASEDPYKGGCKTVKQYMDK